MFKKVLAYAGEYKKYSYLSVGLLLLAVTASILPYLFIYQLIDPLISHERLEISYVVFRLVMIALCFILYACFYISGLAYSHQSAYHTLKNLRISLQRQLERKPLGVIEAKGVGTLKKMFIDDIESIELLLAHALPEGIANLAIPVFIYLAMFFVDYKLALLSLCSLPIGLFAMGAMYKIGFKEMGNYYASAQKMNNTIIEYINGMEVVKVFNRDGESYHRFEGDVKAYRDFTLAWYKACWPWMALYNSILPCVALVTLPVGSWLVLNGSSTLNDLVLVLCMSFAIGAPLIRALSFVSTMPQINYKIEALEKLMDAPDLQASDEAFTGENKDIVYHDVHFGYDKKEVIHGIDLHIKQGTTTALIGESGSGKSTLAKLLVHFYDVDSGSITIGGQDIRQMRISDLNELISFVSQDQFLFNTTLLENIRMGNLMASDEEVKAAAHQAQCDEFFARLEHGIHTMAGDGGKQLSGGERQRISLARAILKDAPIIVLDEATAFMDPENEDKMNKAIEAIIKDKTVIIIAHRLQSVVNADQICLLNDGHLEIAGRHEELLEKSALYRKLWAAAKGRVNWKIETKEVEA